MLLVSDQQRRGTRQANRLLTAYILLLPFNTKHLLYLLKLLFMKHVSLALLMVFIISVIHAQTYITHVSVVDVINMKINADETVVISKEKIAEVGKSISIHIPANATVI